MERSQEILTLDSLDHFPPTVVSHKEHDNGMELVLLDSGTTEEPRAIHIYDDKQTEAWL